MRPVLILYFALAAILVACDENINPPEVDNQVFTIDENTPAGTYIGVVDAYDPDIGQLLQFSLIEGNEEGILAIDPAAGHLSVEDPTRLNYEENPQLFFTVEVSDNGDPVLTATAGLTLTLNDVNEFPPVIGDQAFTIAEKPPQGTPVGTIQASTDPESHQGMIFLILTGNESGAFNLNELSGELSVSKPSEFDAAVNPVFELTVQVRDLHSDSKTATALVTVTVLSE